MSYPHVSQMPGEDRFFGGQSQTKNQASNVGYRPNTPTLK